MIENIDHIFAICDKNKEPNRYNDLKNWISNDFEDISQYTIDAYCYGDSLKQEDLIKYNIDEKLNKGNKSLYLNHIKFFEQILQKFKSGQNFLILESDAVPVENYKEIINEQLNILKDKSWDYLDVGNGLSWTPEKFGHVLNENKNAVYLCKSSRAAHSIVWNYSGIEKFYNCFIESKIKISYPIDYMFYLIMEKINADIYWSHPFAFKQGSQCGIYESTNV